MKTKRDYLKELDKITAKEDMERLLKIAKSEKGKNYIRKKWGLTKRFFGL